MPASVNPRVPAILLALTAAFLGCVADSGADLIGAVERASTGHEGFDVKRIAFNRIAFNRIAFNRLSFENLDGLEQDEDSRELLEYVVRCAFPEGAVLKAEHDGEVYRFHGLLGVAPEWQHGPLPADRYQILSACLLAHVNAYGLSVPISLRAPGIIEADEDERTAYSVYEGTFFGDLFAGAFLTLACTGTDRDLAERLSGDREIRVCTDPTEDCGVLVVGRCRDMCEVYTDKYGWQGCRAFGRYFAETVSVYLRDNVPPHNRRSCPAGEDCHFTCPGGEAIFDCGHAGCDAVCQDGSFCAIDGYGATRLAATVTGESYGEVNCQTAGDCAASCGNSSVCEIECQGANRCDRIMCTGGAQCLLHCAGARACGFAECEGTARRCPGGVIACNRECPEA